MRKIDQLPKGSAGRCAVVPQVGHDDWWVDTGSVLVGVDPHVFVSKTACEELAKQAGWLAPDSLDGPTEALAAADQRIAELEEQVDQLEGVVDAVDRMESAGFRARQKPGRKPKRREEAVV